MADFALWYGVPSAPHFALLCDRGERCELTHLERQTKLAAPIAVKAGDTSLPLDALMRLYPMPQQKEKAA